MFDFMDSRFHTRRILISSVCWIILAFLHVGVYCDVTLEVSGSGMLNSLVTFTCISDNPSQYYANFIRDGQQMAVISRQGISVNDTIEAPFANRVTTSSGQRSQPNTFYYIMKLDKLQCSDEGNYTCSVNLGITSVDSVKPLHVKTMPHMPNLTAPTNFVVLGDLVTLQCSANVGKPPRNLSLCAWQQQGFNCSEISTLVDLGNCVYSQTATMTVNVTEDTNQANCEVITPKGNNLKVSQTWLVYYPVLDIKFVPDNPVVTLMEGESKTITCEARGKPSPSYRWDFQPKNGPVNTAVWPQYRQDLILRNVGLNQIGIYSCIAINNIRNVTYNMTKSITINIVPTTPAPTTTITTPPVKTSSDGHTTKTGPQTNAKNDDWKLIVSTVGAILFLIILIILLVILYRRRSKPAEIEEPPEKPRNNHEVNMKETKPDLVYSTGIDKGKLPMYNTGFDNNGEDDLYYAELAFDDKPRSRKPVVPLYDNSSSNDPYTTVMPQV